MSQISNLNTQNKLIYDILKNYYYVNDYKNLEKIIPIINGQSDISLRLIDWFVTNYAKEHFVTYKVNNSRFAVYLEYKLKLKSYKKRRFDPFCRWDRINMPYKDGLFVQTTIGQLNFFRWALNNKIIDYITSNKVEIEKDMNTRNNISQKNKSKDTNNKTRRKRNELSVSAVKTIKKENVEIVVKFD